jgi:hypothetical protein
MTTKIEAFLDTVDLSSCPHVGSYGERRESDWKGVAVIVTEIDDDENDTYTEITEEEKAKVRHLLRPYQVKFYSGLMLTFGEWLSNVPPRKNPITGSVRANRILGLVK